jgi:transposase
VQRTPLSKQRNKHLQTTLIEAAKMAPRYSSDLALLYDKEKQKGNANRATLAVARKLVAYLSWRSTVGSAIFRWWRRTASLRRAGR